MVPVYPVSPIFIRMNGAHEDRASYLDLCIEVQNKHFHTKMYDKRDSFNFDIVNYPFVQDSNIPENPAYGVYSSKLINIARACDTYTDFKNRHDSLCLKFTRQGFRYKKLVKQLGKSKLKHKDLFTRYQSNIEVPLSIRASNIRHVTLR